MITDSKHFNAKTILINKLIWNQNIQVLPLKRMVFKEFERKKIEELYESVFQNFPIRLEQSCSEFGISIIATELIETYYATEYDQHLQKDKISDIFNRRKIFDPKENLDCVEDFIDEYIHELVYNYERIIKNTKAQYYFSGIEDETKILLSLLRLYKSILRDPERQVDIFWCIQLPKQVSDVIVEIIIEFIENRISILTLSVDAGSLATTEFVEVKLTPVNWLGNQQQLCELFIELESKGWIEKIVDGERRSISNSITKIFDIKRTQRNKVSSPEESFYQVFKGEIEDKKRIHPFMEKPGYKRKFNRIVNK